jgi:adenylate cyclase
MGDGLLAIFPMDESDRAALDALEAVRDIEGIVAEVSAERAAEGLPHTGFSAALHAGDVLYGNIGASRRLDFTVIGPAVNAAARMLGMCASLDQRIVISARVAAPALAHRADLVSLGQYRLRGVAERQELYTLD